jgi:hypothetical protein
LTENQPYKKAGVKRQRAGGYEYQLKLELPGLKPSLKKELY